MYTVQSGDNLWTIAQRYGSTPAAIAAHNGLADANLIFPGQVLAIPGTDAPAVPAAEGGDWWGLAQEMGAKHGVDPRLVWAVIQAESTGSPTAHSPAGAMGLMQLMPDTARWLGVADPWDPRQNVDGGAKYLRFLLDYLRGDVTLAIAGYNAGPGAVDTWGGVPPYDETQLYVRRVRSFLAQAPQPGAAPAPEPEAPAAVPETPAAEAPAEPEAPAPAAPATHTIVSGDTLYDLAARYLGDAGRWAELYEANRDVIGGNPSLIRPGMVLAIPGQTAAVPAPAPEPPAEPAAEAPASPPPAAPPSAIEGADTALAWQAGQLAAGNSYSNWCLAFVNQAYQKAGRWIPELQSPSAADAMDRYAAQGRLQAVDAANPPPRGAVIFYGRTSWNQYGHIVISNGDGTVSTSGWTGYAGSPAISLESLNAKLARKPEGWAQP